MWEHPFGGSTGAPYTPTNAKVSYASDPNILCSIFAQALSYTQYLAVAPFPSRLHSPNIGAKVTRPSKACIQIWSLAPAKGEDDMDDETEDHGQMQCALVLCIDGGPAYELKWCPLPSHDEVRHIPPFYYSGYDR